MRIDERIIFSSLLACVLLEFAGCVGLEDLQSEEVDTLREFEQDANWKAQVVAEEERNFQEVKKAIQDGRLKKGIPSSEIAQQFGQPVLSSPEGKNQRWLYKGRGGHWFKAPKVYLYLDENNQLQRWECLRTDCK